jgi:hypothetical protein
MENLLAFISNHDLTGFTEDWNNRKNEFSEEQKQELISQTIAFHFDEKEFSFFQKVIDLIAENNLNLNFNIEHWAPSLLCLAVHVVSRNLFDFLLSKGADINFIIDKYAFEDEDYIRDEIKVKDERYTTCMEFASMKLEGMLTSEYHYQRPDWSEIDLPWAEIDNSEEMTVSKRYYTYLVEQSQYLYDLVHLNEMVEHIQKLGGKSVKELK